MKAFVQPLAWGLALASILAMASGVAMDMVVTSAHAATAHHPAMHHGDSAPSTRPWPTEAPLREGMTRLRDSVEAALAGDPGQAMDESTAVRLQRDIEEHVAYLIEHCQLSEEADAALHPLLGDLLKGARALSVPAERDQGIELILSALNHYPERFAAPHWQDAARHSH